MSGIIDDILGDAQKLRDRMEQSNCLGPFERQLLSQLFVMNENEKVVQGWLKDIEAPLLKLQQEHIVAQSKALELDGKRGGLTVVDGSAVEVDEQTG